MTTTRMTTTSRERAVGASDPTWSAHGDSHDVSSSTSHNRNTDVHADPAEQPEPAAEEAGRCQQAADRGDQRPARSEAGPARTGSGREAARARSEARGHAARAGGQAARPGTRPGREAGAAARQARAEARHTGRRARVPRSPPPRRRRSRPRPRTASPTSTRTPSSSARSSSTSASSTTPQLETLYEEMRTSDAPLGELAIQRGLINEDQLLQATAELHGMHVVNLEDTKPEAEAVKLVHEEHGRAVQARAAHLRERRAHGRDGRPEQPAGAGRPAEPPRHQAGAAGPRPAKQIEALLAKAYSAEKEESITSMYRRRSRPTQASAPTRWAARPPSTSTT